MSKVRIMLACAAGMSTSLLVTKMQNAAKEKGIDAEIYALSVGEASVKIDDKPEELDIVLLGPQVKYMKNDFAKKVEGKSIKLDVINMMDYGMMNGEKVLDAALAL